MRQTAYNIAKHAFRDKTDKGGNPYMDHLTYVANKSIDYFNRHEGGTEDELFVVSILHDLLEDCPEWNMDHILAIFDTNREIYYPLGLLTKKSNDSYENYIKYISKNNIARAVKLADLKHNMDISRLSQIADEDMGRFQKYLKSYNFLLEKK